MKKYLFLALIPFIFCAKAKAEGLKIVYPKTSPVEIKANSTFFIGSINPSNTLKINNEEVKVPQSGVFAKVVPLNFGLNNFKIVSGPDTINFQISRPQPAKIETNPPILIEYPAKKDFYVKNDNAPLRMTPVDGGINRMSHLPKGMRVYVDGERGDFYRIYLNSKLSGWIAKSDIEQKTTDGNESLPVRIKGINIREDNEFYTYEIDLNGKPVPYIVKEENGLTLQLFNILEQDDCTFCLNVPMQKLMGYYAYYENNRFEKWGKFILKVRKIVQINPEKPLKNIKIAVDAGHGGKEFGAVGGYGDNEKDINLAIAKNVKKELEIRGAKVIMTRERDIDVSLLDRVKTARKKNVAMLLSIHANAVPDGEDPNKNRGTSVYYYHNQAKPLAECILRSMTEQLQTQNDKVRQGSLALVRPTLSLSVLIEAAYIINPDDYLLLLNKNFQTNCSKAIADGVEKYILNLSN